MWMKGFKMKKFIYSLFLCFVITGMAIANETNYSYQNRMPFYGNYNNYGGKVMQFYGNYHPSTYGQHQPVYGTMPPMMYGQQPPMYGNKPPKGEHHMYGQHKPAYGTMPPMMYGQQPPTYGNKPPKMVQ